MCVLFGTLSSWEKSIYCLSIGPICEEPGKIKNGYATVINGSPDNSLQDDVKYNMRTGKYERKDLGENTHGAELQQLEYKCKIGFVLWGNARIVCHYNNR